MGDGELTFYEFFAGGGMARAGLGPLWRCSFANDFSPMKAAAYAANWGAEHLVCGDVAKLGASDLPSKADLAWASFPCQDLSLAGDKAGLGRVASLTATRSGTFWPFWSLMCDLRSEGRAPRAIVLENVFGALTSNKGQDFVAICDALTAAGYHFGALVIDAVAFVPQSRPRVFFVAVERDVPLPGNLTATGPSEAWHPKALRLAASRLTGSAKRNWRWWRLPSPTGPVSTFGDFLEQSPSDVGWHTKPETGRVLAMMTPVNRAKVEAAKLLGVRVVGTIYKRTRPDPDGVKRQRAEVRFDGVAGCLRTPAGGSSRQTIIVVEGDSVRTRLLSAREAARLMGLDDSYKLPGRYNDAYHVVGDGVCPPVVRFIAEHLLEPLALCGRPALLRLMSAA